MERVYRFLLIKKFYDNLKVQYKNALGREYAGILNTDSYVATLKTIAGTRDAYFQPENQMLFELAGWLLGPKTKEMDTLAKILAHYNVNGLIGKSISNILSDITVSGVQTAFDKENQNNKEILITIDGYLEDTVNMNESEFEDWRTSISNTSTFEKLQDEMNIAIRTRSDLVQLRKEVKEEMDSFSYTQSNLETILSLFYTTKGELKNAIFDGHTPLTYVKWINSTYYGWRGWQNNDDVKNMEIENNIKRIDISCFQGCQNLNQVILPDTLEHVRRDAFEGCTGIKELTMPVDLDYVKTSYTNGNPSFYNCGNIEKITYSKGKTGIMPDIKSNKEGVYISYYTAEYYAGKNLTTVEFEEGVKNIGARAYYSYRTSINSGMPNLKNIKLASTVKKIGDYAFCNNKAITDFDFSNIEELGERSFSGCSGLSDLTIPAGLKEMPYFCFYGCTGLSSLKIPETIEKVCGGAFGDCTGIKELTMPVDLDYVKNNSSTNGYSSFFNCGNIEKITYSKGKTGIMPDIESGSTSYDTAECYAGKSLTTVEFEEGVKNIGARAYYFYRNSITSGCVYGMPNLKNIKLASTVKKIGDYAFYKNIEITKFDFSNIEELGESSFSGCRGLSDLTIPAGLKEIPASCFYECTGLSSLKIPETIEKVCGGAFGDCTGIKELTMPVDLDYVKNGYSSFSNCGNIEKITYSKGKTGIMPDIDKGSTWYYTAEYYAGNNLTTVEFEEGVKNIGARAYCWHADAGGSGLKNIKLASTVKKIGDDAFYENTEITKFDFSNIEELGESSFYGCSGLTDLTIPAGMKEIPASCFYECTSLSSLKIPETIEKVCGYAFGDCTGIKELTMPVDLDYVNKSRPSFRDCGNIEKITYSKGKTGIMPDTDNADIDNGSTWYYTAEYYAGNNLTTVEFEEGVKNIGARAYCWHAGAGGSGLKNIKLASTVKKIGDDAFYKNTEITKFDFSNIEELGERSFYGCSGLSDLTIPAGMKEIPASCFYECTSLSSLKIPETIEKVHESAFSGCTGIKELTMPVDLDYVKKSYSSFSNCGNIEKITYSKGKTGIMPDIDKGSTWYYTAEYYAGNNLTTIEFEEGVKNIGARAYCWHAGAGGSGLKNIKLASTVKKIGDDAFYKNTEITKFDFSNIEELGERSFYGCSGLSDLTIPAGMKEIPASCFYECTSLSSLKIPETIEKVHESAFSGCTGIKELTMPVDLDYVKKSYSSFSNCGNIEKITYSKGKTGIMPDIDKGSTWYYTAEYYAGNNLTTIEFEEGVKNIGASAYYLHDWHADGGGSGLKNIKLASTVKKIGDDAFYKNTEITKFDFSNIEELGERSFYGCSGLSDLTIPAGMKEIPASCFYGCTSLSSLKISETIEKVCGDAFEDCTGIKELTMPVDLDYVKAYSSTDGYPSFRNCGNIEKITYSKGKTGTMPDIKSGSASYYTAEYYAGKKLTTVEFQSGIEYIGAGSFDQASALKNIVLPCTVSAISSKTFCAINKSEAVIYGTKDTYAEAYAKEQKIPFRGWNDPIITSEEPVAAPEEQVQLVGIAYTGVDEYVNISDWSVKECESKDTHIDENGLLTVGKDEPKGEIVVAACYGNYTETVKVRIVNPTYTVHFVGDITLDAKTDENCNVYCPKEYEEKGYEYQYYLGKDTDSEQIEEKDWPLTVAQDTEIYVKKILKEPSIDKINPTEKEMDFIYDGEKREISISASHEIGEKGVLSYQWYYDEMQDGDFEEIHLATGASISVKDVKDSGVYKCRVTLCDGKDTTWVDSKVVCVNITQRLVPIPILQDSQKNLYYTGVEQKLLFEKLETDWVNITEAAATLPGNYVASVGLKDAENSIWADSTKEAKEYPWKIIGKETTPKPLESPTVTNAPTYEPGNTARPSGAPDENPSKTPEIKPGEVPTESRAATDTPTYEPGNTARPSGAPDENPERTPEIKASEVPTDVPEIKPTIAPDKITTGSQDTDLVFQPEDMTGDSREEALFLEKKVNVKKLRNKKKNKLYISWGKVELPQKAFYQVQISTKRNFKGAKNIYTTKSIYCYKGVKKGKKYYVRVRLGVTRDGKKIYGKWSNLKKKKIKN